MGASTQDTPDPGWYADPNGVAELRYWDGNQWTEHLHGGPDDEKEQQVASPAASSIEGDANDPAQAGHFRSDIAAAKSKMRVKIGGGREIKRLQSHLWEGETVDQMTTGLYVKGNGLLVLTDRRLLFLHEGLMSKTSEDFPIDKVSSVSWSAGMLVGTITVFASGNKSEIKSVNKDDGKEIVDKLRHRLSAPAVSSPTQATEAPSVPDPIEQLKRLGELRHAGVLTEQEFEAKKAELLGRL